MLHRDEWLSTYFSKGAYSYTEPYKVLSFPSGFIYTKVPTENIQQLEVLFRQGFKLVEVLANFQQQTKLGLIEDKRLTIDWVKMEASDQVIEIARNSFRYSRFSMDKSINSETASAIKADWVANFFKGKRGTQMVAAQQKNKVVGFVLLINNIIDLIAVHPKSERQGIGTKMIAFANQEIGLLKAGTQIINQPSISLYQKLNFYLTNSQFVLHKNVN